MANEKNKIEKRPAQHEYLEKSDGTSRKDKTTLELLKKARKEKE